MPSATHQRVTCHLIFAIFASAIGSGFQHGYNTGVVNAPQDLVEDFINQTFFDRYQEHPHHTIITVIFSTIVSMYSLGGMFGGLGTAFLAEKFGSRGGLLLNNILVFIAAALMGFSKMAGTYEMFIVGRFIVGLNAGFNAGLAPMYLTEISPINIRGAVGTIYQLIITMSILISQILGLPQILGTKELWPILFGLIVIPAILMIIVLPICPESPKHLLIRLGKEDEAKKALMWFRGTDDVSKEMKLLRSESEEIKCSPKMNLAEMWMDRSLRKPLIISMVVMLSQQFSGINAVIYYSTSIFQHGGLERNIAVYATLGIGVINVLMTIVSMVLVEKAGRRTLHLIGLGGMAIITILLTICIAFTSYASWLSYLSIVFVIGFIIMFATGPGSIPWFLVNELFGQCYRPIACSIAVAINWLANFIVGLTFLPIKAAIGEYVFLIFAVLLILFFIFTYVEVPETKGRTIEEITAEFREKVSK